MAGAGERRGERAGVVNESSLTRRAQQGDLDAYEDLMRQHQDIAHRAAYLVTGNAADAEDAVQEAFVKAWYALDAFDTSRPFRPWLLRIVTNEAHTRRRSVARHTRLALRAMEQAPQEPAPSPESGLLHSEQQDDVIAALNRLPELDRLVIAYRYFLDLTPAEMAESLGKPAGTIRSRLHRALNRLREQMSADNACSTDGSKGALHG